MNQRRWPDIILVVGPPLLLAILEVFHPHPGDLLKLDLRMWLMVHYLQIPLFPLVALAVAVLLRGRTDIAATLSRVVMFVFGVSYTAFDTAAGVVTGILVEAARASDNPDAWRPAIEAVWTHPIVGGSPLMAAPLLAVVGAVGLSVGTVTAAISLKRAGSSWAPVALLALAGFGLSIFKTHAWPGGPLTFGGLALAGVWLEWERAGKSV
jgi:hypothetical protein